MSFKKLIIFTATVFLATALVFSFSYAQENTEQNKEKVKTEQREKTMTQEKAQIKNQAAEQTQIQEKERTREQEQVRAEVQENIENQANPESQSQTQVRNEIQNRVEVRENEEGQPEVQHQLQIQHQIQNQTVQNEVTITKEGDGKPEVEHTLTNNKKEQNQNKATIRTEERARIQNKIKQQDKTKERTKRGPYVDENGDGINDFYRDHDADGIPNCQDPDWTAPKDGTGYKGSPDDTGFPQVMNKSMNRNTTWTRNAFRNQVSLASQICDGSGPKGKVSRKGNR